MASKPLITQIHYNAAAPFMEKYCADFGVPYNGEPDFGYKIVWFGALLGGRVRAVIGLVAIPEGVYVLGYFKDNTMAGSRCLMALNKWTYTLEQPLWGHIREDNPTMWNRMLKEGWHIVRGNGTDLLVHWPMNRSISVLKFQVVASKE